MPIYTISYLIKNKIVNINYFEAVDDAAAEIEQEERARYTDKPEGLSIEIARSELGIMKHYLRMARPQIGGSGYMSVEGPGPYYSYEESHHHPLPHDAVSLSTSMNQLTLLVRNLKDIFTVVEPNQGTIQAYGPLIRNTLLLAAMDFENECKGVLRANNYVSPNTYWKTEDYVKLCSALRLEEYEISLGFYSAVAPRRPFSGWNAQAPTQSLPWYAAYNAVKHDRENAISQATVAAAIDAVMACAIMLAAEYRLIGSWKDQIGDFFHFVQAPNWPAEQRYIYQEDSSPWTAVPYNF